MTISRNLSFLAEGVSSTGVLGATYGGTGQSSITTGDLLYGSASNTISKLAIGFTGTILRVVGGVPTWGTDYTGTVTSVAASVPSFLSISGSPITTSGTLAITYSGTALPIANGGTAQTSFTAGQILYGSFSQSSNLFWDSTNSRLGIGTSSPSGPLDIQTSSTGSVLQRFWNTDTSGTGYSLFRIANSGNNAQGSQLQFTDSQYFVATITGDRTNGMKFYTGQQANSTANFVMQLDASGNLGLGVTPSSSLSGWKSFEVAGLGQQWFVKNDSTDWHLTNNAYYSSGWKRGVSGAATDYEQNAGTHIWLNAGTGGSSSAISWTQAMTLDNQGTLLVGQTSYSSTTLGFSVLGGGNANTGAVSTALAASGSGISTWVTYSTGAGAYRFYVDMSGTIHATSMVITAISDQRLKENIKDLDLGLSTIMALKPRRFDWKEGKGQDKKNAVGFIAQEYQEVLPNSISTFKAGEDGIDYLTMNHEELIPTLVKAIQEQQAIIEQLKAKVGI